MPLILTSIEEVREEISSNYIMHRLTRNNPVSLASVLADIIMKHHNFQCCDRLVYIYNKMTNLYTVDLQDYVYKLVLSSKQDANEKLIKDIVELLRMNVNELLVNRDYSGSLLPYKPKPPYVIAANNGLANTITREVEPYTPEYFCASKIATNYNIHAEEPTYKNGFTFEEFVSDFAAGNKLREELIIQICRRAIIPELNTDDKFVVVVGPGGDGKSTFFSKFLARLIDQSNVASIQMSDINVGNRLVNAIGKNLILGGDNGSIHLKESGTIKSLVTREPVTADAKYKDPITFVFYGLMIQIFNKLPTFQSEEAQAFARRLLVVQAKGNFVLGGKTNDEVSQIIEEQDFLEDALIKIFDYNKYPLYDKAIMIDSVSTIHELYESDPIVDFLSQAFPDQLPKAISFQELYQSYLSYQKVMGITTNMHMRTFLSKVYPKLEKLGYNKKEKSRLKRAETEYGLNRGDYARFKPMHSIFDSNTNDPVNIVVRTDETPTIESIIQSTGKITAPARRISIREFFETKTRKGSVEPMKKTPRKIEAYEDIDAVQEEIDQSEWTDENESIEIVTESSSEKHLTDQLNLIITKENLSQLIDEIPDDETRDEYITKVSNYIIANHPIDSIPAKVLETEMQSSSMSHLAYVLKEYNQLLDGGDSDDVTDV